MTVENEIATSILIVDDDSLMLNLTKQILTQLGYSRIDTAINGRIALGKLITTEIPYDVIICDLNMPEMDGFEFMRHAKESNFEGSLILFSGEDRRMLEITRDLAAELKLNVLGALSKPVSPIELKELLDELRPAQSEKRVAATIDPITREELEAGIEGDGDELLMYYQPVVHIRSGEVSGVETLARWHHPKRGVLPPYTFIPLAEQTGLIDALTLKIFRMAAQQTVEWIKEGYFLKTSVNFSISSLSNSEFANNLIAIADEVGIDPQLMILELDEKQVMENAAGCMEVMMRMRFNKFGLSVDDFGTGNSSFEQIKRIPITEFKIARSFVHDAAKNSGSKAILEASVNLAKSLKIEIVAKGVENRSDWDLVESLGYDCVQGSFCANAMPIEKFADFMDNWRAPLRTKR